MRIDVVVVFSCGEEVVKADAPVATEARRMAEQEIFMVDRRVFEEDESVVG
jgi:hypothetical protein